MKVLFVSCYVGEEAILYRLPVELVDGFAFSEAAKKVAACLLLGYTPICTYRGDVIDITSVAALKAILDSL